MNYQVRRRGEDLGSFSLEQLRQHRASGALNGGEYVQPEGGKDWQPLDLVLQSGYRMSPPAISAQASPGLHPGIWVAIIGGIIVFGALMTWSVTRTINRSRNYYPIPHANTPVRSRPEAMAAATKKIVWMTNTLTETDATARAKEFRARQWLAGYRERGGHNPKYDATVMAYLQKWLAESYGGPEQTNDFNLEAAGERLAADPAFNEPLVLTRIAESSRDTTNAIKCFERALKEFPNSTHRAYPQLYALEEQQRFSGRENPGSFETDARALRLFQECFADGSFLPGDEQEVAEILVNSWGNNFFHRHLDSVGMIVHAAGTNFQWLALVVDGEGEIAKAWLARGGGYAGSVSASGWEGFNSHLAAARNHLTEAWNLHPDFPLAPCRMIYVSLGDSDIAEMREWFDRTLTAQIDYPRAWKDFRWGLRPRWYGDEASLLALGKTAVATGRFDTDVPRKFIDCIYDVEAEEEMPTGRHIFGRADIWPQIEKMYDGYLAAPGQTNRQTGWRTSYAVIAYLGGKFDVSRRQLEMLGWKPAAGILAEWRLDRTLFPLEVAARTGPLAEKIADAETSYQAENFVAALKKYRALNAANADDRTREFIQRRLARLQPGVPSPEQLQPFPAPAVH